MAIHLRLRITLVSLVATFFLAIPASAGEIHDLLWSGKIEKAKALLAKDPKLKDARDEKKRTPLHIAVGMGQFEMVKLLLELGADVNSRGFNQFSPFEAALETSPLYLANNPEILKLLIAYKADLEAKGRGETALQRASRYYQFAKATPEQKWYPLTTEKWRTLTMVLLDAGARYDVFSAIYLDDQNRIKELLKADPSIPKISDFMRKETRHGLMPSVSDLMREATRNGKTEIVKLLLNHKADPTEANWNNWPLLYFALEYPEIVKLFIEAGADPRVRLVWHGSGSSLVHGKMLLHFAAEKGFVETAKLLIEAGVDVNDRRDGDNATPLMFAAYNGQVELVKLLLEKKATIQGEDGTRVISAAACWLYHSDKKAEQIATYKAMIDKLRDKGTARDILTAVMLNETEVLRKLVKDKPELLSAKVTWCQYRHKMPILIVAVLMDRKEIVGALLDAGSPVEGKDDDGYTALHTAAYADSKEMARLLISYKADVNSRDNNRSTPLYVAAQYGSVEVAKILIAAGADIHARDDQGLTPLHMVAGNEEVAKLLIAAGAKVNAKDDQARTPLHLAAGHDEPGLIKLLIAHGADVKAKDNLGKTPLHAAATDGTVDVAKQLIDSGADVNAKDNEGKTPLASVDESYIRMIEFLQKHGGK